MSKKSYDKIYEEKKKDAAPAEEPVVDEAKASIDEPVKESVEPEEIPMTKPFMGTVIGGLSLNVRKTPNGEIIGALAEGAQVKVLEIANADWYKIESPEGYVMKRFIKKG